MYASLSFINLLYFMFQSAFATGHN